MFSTLAREDPPDEDMPWEITDVSAEFECP
jgi:hypothetical protein